MGLIVLALALFGIVYLLSMLIIKVVEITDVKIWRD